MGVLQTPLLCIRFLCKVDNYNDKSIHVPTCTYNEVMQILEMVGVVESE